MFECTNDTEGDRDYSKPMPLIGCYIAAASLVCLLAIIAGSCSSLIWQQSSRYLSMNAVSLTIFSVAIKLSTDLTTAMPREIDQLAKLSTSLFICVVVCNSIPSLGKMSNRQAVTNIIALAILIITSVVNLCIQLATQVIFYYRIAHVLLIVVMLFLLTLCGVAAISLASIKDYLQVVYEKKHQRAQKEFESDETKTLTEKLEDYLKKFSIMAQSGCPQYVLTRSAAWSIVSESLSLVIVFFSFLGWLLRRLVGGSYSSCESDYKWSVLLIVMTQALVTFFGIIPKTRKSYTHPKIGISISRPVTGTITVGNYLTQSVIEMTESQLFVFIHNSHGGKVMECVKDTLFYFLNVIYRGVIFAAPLIFFFWAWCFKAVSFPIACCYDFCEVIFRWSNNDPGDNHPLKPYVLHLVGEEKSVGKLLTHCLGTTQSYLGRGRKDQPEHLIDLLKKRKDGFNGVFNFDSTRVPPLSDSQQPRNQVPPSLDSQQPTSNCWTLALVTLTSIAIALPNIEHDVINNLLLSVSEGLLYVNQIEDCFNDRRDMIYVMKASKIVWKGVDLHRKWLDVDLAALALRKRNNPREVLESLAKIAEEKFLESRKSEPKASIWSAKEVAAQCMYRLSKTLLLDYIDEGDADRQSKDKDKGEASQQSKDKDKGKGKASQQSKDKDKGKGKASQSSKDKGKKKIEDNGKEKIEDKGKGKIEDKGKEKIKDKGKGNASQQSKKMFKKLEETISDIMGACLTNLKDLILKECSQSSIEKRKETAFHILDLFGKTEEVMKTLEKRERPGLSLDKLPFIDEWRPSRGEGDQSV